MKPLNIIVFLLLPNLFLATAQFNAGVGRVDITPDYPIRLSGFAVRKTESEGVAQRIYAKALAISQPESQIAIVLTVDNCGISKAIRDEIVDRIQQQHSISPERIVIFSSHTHSAPCLSGTIENLFVGPLPENQLATIDRYTRELVDKMVRVAGIALLDRQPARLYFGRTRASFAKNRRPQGGPVDHDVPVLVLRDAEGKLRALLANYACHCTTLLGDQNQVHGDWAGVVQEWLEKNNPGATAFISIGCGADSNPSPRGQMEHVLKHGQELAQAVEQVAHTELTELINPIQFRTKALDLPFDPLPSREEWEKRATEAGIVGYHARKNLERLGRGETLPASLPYLVQTWNFGSELAMVFLPGEVVVDYSLALKRDFDPARLWVSAYANWVPCYIPSVRILKEGGYEAESSLWYYDRPARLSEDTERLILSAVRDLLPSDFRTR